MSVVDNRSARELPWRPNYRVFAVAGMDDGRDATLHYSLIDPGAGAPLHTHDVDEFICVIEGRLNGRIGDEKKVVEANQTMVIPKGVPHGFNGAGPGAARTLAFFPCPDGQQKTKYLEGGPPEIYKKK